MVLLVEVKQLYTGQSSSVCILLHAKSTLLTTSIDSYHMNFTLAIICLDLLWDGMGRARGAPAPPPPPTIKYFVSCNAKIVGVSKFLFHSLRMQHQLGIHNLQVGLAVKCTAFTGSHLRPMQINVPLFHWQSLQAHQFDAPQSRHQ